MLKVLEIEIMEGSRSAIQFCEFESRRSGFKSKFAWRIF
jgi:hypothetical protein